MLIIFSETFPYTIKTKFVVYNANKQNVTLDLIGLKCHIYEDKKLFFFYYYYVVVHSMKAVAGPKEGTKVKIKYKYPGPQCFVTGFSTTCS